MGNPGHQEVLSAQLLGNEIGSRLALNGWVAGDDHFLNLTTIEVSNQLVDTQLIRTNAVNGRQMTHKDEILPFIHAGLLNRINIRR